MSAFLVDAETIDFIVEGGLLYGFGELVFEGTDGLLALTPGTATAVGKLLVATNMESVQHCYENDTFEEMPGPGDRSRLADYEFQPTEVEISPIVLVKQLACYRYQSCEHSGWQTSDACRFMEKLIEAAEAAMDPAMLETVRNPYQAGETKAYKVSYEYDEAPWGVTREDLNEMHPASQSRAA